jgi:hypothetical protein
MQEISASQVKSNQKVLKRINALQQQVLQIEHVCSGTVVRSMLRCGKPNCRCATDPDARHGPYFQWNRMKKGKLVHSTITAEQALFLKKAIANYRYVLKLLRRWEEETRKFAEVK